MRFLTDAVVTDAAVRRSRWSEDLAGVAVLELDDLVVDLHIADSRWGSLPRRDVPIGCLCGNKKHPSVGVGDLFHTTNCSKKVSSNRTKD